MRKKLSLSELPKNAKRKFKDECEGCNTYKEDVHSYYDNENRVYLLCPDCLKKNKLIVRNWKNEPVLRKEEIKHEKNKSTEKTRTEKSAGKNNKNSSNTKDVSKDSRQLLHGGVSRRKRSTEQSEHRSGKRKSTLI